MTVSLDSVDFTSIINKRGIKIITQDISFRWTLP